jgi:hypothetical protein
MKHVFHAAVKRHDHGAERHDGRAHLQEASGAVG